MSKSYTPGLVVLENTKIRKNRQLPIKGKVLVEVGEEILSDKIVASTKIPGNVQMLNAANKLNIEPENIQECMLVKIDENVEKGQVIAENKGLFGLFKTNLKTPIDGTIANISDITGQIIIVPKLADPEAKGAVKSCLSKKVKGMLL